MAVKLSTKYADNFISDEALASMRAEAESAFEKVMTGSGVIISVGEISPSTMTEKSLTVSRRLLSISEPTATFLSLSVSADPISAQERLSNS